MVEAVTRSSAGSGSFSKGEAWANSWRVTNHLGVAVSA